MPQPSLGIRRVEFADLIAGVGAVAQCLIAMPEALRHVEGRHIVLVELDRDMLEIGPALRPKVDDDVEDGTPRASYQLGLGRRRILKVHPPKCAFLQVRSDIGLGDDGFQPVLTELILAEGACEKTSLVVPAFEVDDEGAFELGLGEYHLGFLSSRSQLQRRVQAGARRSGNV